MGVTLTMTTRFRVATRATGIRRQVWVHVYDDREQMARAHLAALDRDYDSEPNASDIAGGMAGQTTYGYPWPQPDPGPVMVIRFWTGQLTTRTISHEATHAAAMMSFLDVMPGWNSRARGILLGNNEPLCYAVGDITSDIIGHLYRLDLIRT